MALQSQGEDTRGYTLFEAALCPPSKSPLTLDTGAHNPGANIKGAMALRANSAKERVSGPQSVYSKNCISGSQGRWTLGFCIEAIKSLKSLYQHWFGSEAQEKHFGHFGP